MNILVKVLLNALILLMVAYLVPGIVVASVYTAIIAAVILGLLNAVVRPVLVVLTLPITLITLGLFTFVINAALFLFAASFIEGFSVSSFWVALLGSFLVSIFSSVASKLLD